MRARQVRCRRTSRPRGPRGAQHEGQGNGRGRRGHQTQEPRQPPLPAEQRQESEGHAGDDDALGIDQAEDEGAREHCEQQGGPSGTLAVAVVADEHADGHHSGQSRDPTDDEAHHQGREPGEVGKPADDEGEGGEEGNGVPGHVAVGHGQVTGPSVHGGADEPLTVPDVEVGVQRLVGEAVGGGCTGNRRGASRQVGEYGPEQEPPANALGCGPSGLVALRCHDGLRRPRTGVAQHDGGRCGRPVA